VAAGGVGTGGGADAARNALRQVVDAASSEVARSKSRRVILEFNSRTPLATRSDIQLLKNSVMLVAEKACVDVVYRPTAVIPVARLAALSIDCNRAMNAA
jgi:hypothetical protein